VTTLALPRRLDQPTEPPDAGRDIHEPMAFVRALLYPALTPDEKGRLRKALHDCGYRRNTADDVLATIQEARDESWEAAAVVFDHAETDIAETLREDGRRQ
jgi:hypothetical protein